MGTEMGVVVKEREKARWSLKALVPGLLLVLCLTVFLSAGKWNPDIFQIQITTQMKEEVAHDKLLGGLLSPDFDEESCLSRYRSSMYRKPSPFPVSPYLVQRLRAYEAYHKKCGPYSELYNKSVEQLKSGQNGEQAECKYVVWTKWNGLGNRMLSFASTFLYALLTNRVVLMEIPKNAENLFCEPFPGTSWALPSDFPINNFWRFKENAPESYTYMVKKGMINDSVDIPTDSLPPYVYLHLIEIANFRLEDNIFCESDQRILQKFNWIVTRSDNHFAVALFLLPMYREELEKLFPEKESVFHHLGRYLFHPSNPVWEMIERFYNSYLAHATKRIGVQIREFPSDPFPSEKIYQNILECSRKEKILPQIGRLNRTNSFPNTTKLTAILVASLFSGYYDKIKSAYYENSTTTGEMVAVYQPSHEDKQKEDNQLHDQKALAEIYLLSYSHEIITSSISTFGYVSHALGGLRPWIVRTSGWMQLAPEPVCVRSESVEPCALDRPILKCKTGTDKDGADLVPYIRHCEDAPLALKLFDS